MTLYNKAKWSLGILMVFVLIVTTNLIDRNNFVRVRDSVVTIYEDRLIAKNLIYQISQSIHEKELALVLPDTTFFTRENLKANSDIQSAINAFEQTKLTPEEDEVFSDLKENLKALQEMELAFVNSGFSNKKEVASRITTIKNNLNNLSKIQINEGRRQMSISRKAISTVELFTQIEIYILVFLAIVIQVIVMYKPKKTD